MSKLEVVESFLNEDLIDKSGVLEESNLDVNGVPFKMSRQIVIKSGIRYSIYKFDVKKDLLPFFNSNKGIKKMCDYILFLEEGNHLFILLIELKLGSKKGTTQLEAAHCFVNYLFATINRLNDSFEFNEENFHFRKIVIQESSSKKVPLRTTLTNKIDEIHDSPHPNLFFPLNYLSY